MDIRRAKPTHTPRRVAGAVLAAEREGLARSARHAALVALAAQFAVLYAPRAPAVATTTSLPIDKLVHLAVFALSTAALIRAGAPPRRVVTAMTVHAPVSELIQGRMLEGRSAERADAVADLAGVVLGTLATRRAVLGRLQRGRGR